MHYLIDGHNLIGKLPDIKLSDADDEIRLLLRLKSWVSGGQQRQVTVVFDGVGAGGVAHRLSSKAITVIFAPGEKTADDLLIKRLQGLRNPHQYTLVSSDRRILDAAQIARIKHLTSERFIEEFGFVFQKPETKPAPPPVPPPLEKEDDPQLSDAELDEWLRLFGPVPKRPSRKRGSSSVLRQPEQPPPLEPEAEPVVKRLLTPAEYADMAESENPELDAEEVAEWMALFGTAAQQKRPLPPKSATSPPQKDKPDKPGKPGRLTVMKDTKRKLTKNEVDEWLKLFGDKE